MGTSSTFGTSNSHVKYNIKIIQNSQSIEGNYSNVSVWVDFWRDNVGYTTYGSGTCYCKINGTTYSATVSPSQKITNSGITLFSKTLDIYHNSDGSKYLETSAWISMDTPLSSSEHSYGEWLTTIPRASSISSISGNIFGSSVTVSINRASGSFTHKVDYVRPNGEHFRVGENIGTSCTFTPALSDCNFVPNSTSASAQIYVYTYSGSTYIGSFSKSFTVYVPSNVVPTINSVSLSEAVSGISAQFGGYVQGKSKISGSISASGAYSSTIKSYSISINGANYTSNNFTTDFLTISGSNSYTVKITDSRNRTVSSTKNFTVIPYSNPVINSFSVSRCNLDGTANDEGNCAKFSISATISSVTGKNIKSFKIMYKKISDSSWNTLILNGSSYYLNTTQVIQNIDTESEYNFKAVATDYFSTVEKLHNLSTAFTLMDFRSTGRGIAIGRVSSEDCFQVAMDIKQEDYFNGRRCQYVPETVNGTKSGWFLVLHGENNVQYDNYTCLLAVTKVHSGSGNYVSGIISLNVRVDNYNMFAVDFRMVCGNLPPDRFRLVCGSYTDFYVYAKTDGTWEKYMFEVLSESREVVSTYSPIFKFNSGSEPISGDPGGIIPGSGEQITFNEGSWVPNISSRGGVSPTSTIQYRYARYKRINNLCYVTFHGKWSISNAGTDYACITGLPYASTGGVNGQSLAIHEMFGAITTNPTRAGIIPDNSTRIDLQGENGAYSSQWQTGDVWVGFSGFYLIAT